ncbi:MAG: ABC transporter substrate-binding protein, partial [Acidimicrobiales bacterium]
MASKQQCQILHRWAGLLLAFTLLGAACAGSDQQAAPETTVEANQPQPTNAPTDSPTTSQTSPPPSAAAVLTASFRGVTADTITIGAVSPDFDELRTLGLVDLNLGDQELVVQSLIDDLNERGGINGRRVELKWRPYSLLGGQDAARVCIELTKDVELFAVVSAFISFASSSNACILENTMIVGGIPEVEIIETAEAPWVTSAMSSDRVLRGVLRLADLEGMFDGKRVAVTISAAEIALLEDSVRPELEALGIEVVVETVLDVASGDVVAANAQYAVFNEIYRAEEIDLLLSVGTSVAFVIQQLRADGLDTTVLSVDSGLALIGATATGADAEVLAGTVGSMLLSDEQLWTQPGFLRCVEVLEAADPSIKVVPSGEVPEGDPDWQTPVRGACGQVALFEQGAIAAGSELTHDSFVAGAISLGDGVEMPTIPFASLGVDKLDAGDSLQLGVFDPKVGLNGGMRPIAEVVDLG